MKLLCLMLLFSGVMLLAAGCGASSDDQPTLTFGVVADIQYADREHKGSRRYNEAIDKLEKAIVAFNQHQPAFVLQLGDLFDVTPDDPQTTQQNLQTVADTLPQLDVPWRHVVGNHCLDAGREPYRQQVMDGPWHYTFDAGGWRFIVLDGNDISTRDLPDDDPRYQQALGYIKADPRNHKPWNGAIGRPQIDWLTEQLTAADRAGLPVILACHFPVSAAATGGDQTILLWNAEHLLTLIRRHPCVKAYLAGHHHSGGYAEVDGVHHLTIQAICDAPSNGNAFALVNLHPDRITLQGTGDVPDRTLPIRTRDTD